MQNYDLPDVQYDTTFPGVVFTLPTGVAYDLTGASVKLQVRKSPGAPVAKEFASPTGLLITLPYTITMPEQSVSLPPGVYEWDMKITFADGREKIWIGGTWESLAVITV